MSRSVLLGKGCENFVDGGFSDIHQHVRIRESLHCPDLIALLWCRQTIKGLSAIVFLKHFLVSDWSHSVIVEFEPSGIPIRLDESKVMSAMQISGMHEYAMQFIDPVLILFWDGLVDVVLEVNLEREFVTVVDLEHVFSG